MPTLQELFKKAFVLWREKSVNEPPKHGFSTYDHFKALGNEIQTVSIRLGFGELKTKVSVGMGTWAEIPWIGIRHPQLTDSFEEGLYIVYLFAPDFDKLFLAVIQGVTKLSASALNESTPHLRTEIAKPNNFSVGIQGKLSKDAPLESKPGKYERALLYSLSYDAQTLPDDEVLKRDLKAALLVYREYIDKNL